jgi:hypothetical protein
MAMAVDMSHAVTQRGMAQRGVRVFALNRFASEANRFGAGVDLSI